MREVSETGEDSIFAEEKTTQRTDALQINVNLYDIYEADHFDQI